MRSSNPDRKSDKEIFAVAELCEMVGFCLYQFSRIEESMAALYATAAGIANIETAFRSHDEVREFQFRLGMTDAAVRSWIDHLRDPGTEADLRTEWNALHRIVKEDSQDRNRIAHFRIMPNDNDDGTTTWFICPYFQYYSHLSEYDRKDEKFRIPAGIRKFDSKSMRAKLTRFDKTARRVDRFIMSLARAGARLPEYASRPSDPQD